MVSPFEKFASEIKQASDRGQFSTQSDPNVSVSVDTKSRTLRVDRPSTSSYGRRSSTPLPTPEPQQLIEGRDRALRHQKKIHNMEMASMPPVTSGGFGSSDTTKLLMYGGIALGLISLLRR